MSEILPSLPNLIWLYILLGFMVIPPIRQWVAFMRLSQLIARIERKRGTRVITLIHRQGSGIFGMLYSRYISMEDSQRIMDAIRRAGNRPIDLLVHTPGGLVLASEQIARVLNHHRAPVTVIVPQYAMSGGTMLALAADQILMDEHAVLGPIDPQLKGLPASAYLRVVRDKDPDRVEDETLMMAHLAERATAQVWEMAYTLLRDKMEGEQAEEVATILSEGRWTHDYPLHVEQLQELGLPVSTDLPHEFRLLLSMSHPSHARVMRQAE